MKPSENTFFWSDAYTTELEDVVESEKIYLQQRRHLYELPPLDESIRRSGRSIVGESRYQEGGFDLLPLLWA